MGELLLPRLYTLWTSESVSRHLCYSCPTRRFNRLVLQSSLAEIHLHTFGFGEG